MGTFSAIHWVITLVLLAGVSAFIYFVGSLLWAGAKTEGKGKLIAAAVLLPVVLLAAIGMSGAAGLSSNTQQQEAKKALCSDIDAFLEVCKR